MRNRGSGQTRGDLRPCRFHDRRISVLHRPYGRFRPGAFQETPVAGCNRSCRTRRIAKHCKRAGDRVGHARRKRPRQRQGHGTDHRHLHRRPENGAAVALHRRRCAGLCIAPEHGARRADAFYQGDRSQRRAHGSRIRNQRAAGRSGARRRIGARRPRARLAECHPRRPARLERVAHLGQLPGHGTGPDQHTGFPECARRTAWRHRRDIRPVAERKRQHGCDPERRSFGPAKRRLHRGCNGRHRRPAEPCSTAQRRPFGAAFDVAERRHLAERHDWQDRPQFGAGSRHERLSGHQFCSPDRGRIKPGRVQLSASVDPRHRNRSCRNDGESSRRKVRISRWVRWE